MDTGERALEALRARFAPADLRALAGVPVVDVIQGARKRRAAALLDSRLVETEESRRETPVICALHAFGVEREAGRTPPQSVVFEPWDGALC